MKIAEVPLSMCPNHRLRLPRPPKFWKWDAPDPSTTVDTQYTELVLEARLDMNGFPCFAAYDAQTDTFYVCYE